MNWRAAWAIGTTYAVNDGVSYSGSSYIALLAGAGYEPDVAPTHWSLVASVGATGPQGAPGTGSGNVNGPGTNTDGWIPEWNGANTNTLKNGINPITLLTTSSVLPHSFGATFDGGTTALSTFGTVLTYLTMPYACTITSWDILSTAGISPPVAPGTVTFQLWKMASGTALPTVSNSINTSGLSLSTGTVIHSTTLTDFTTTAVSANDVFGLYMAATGSATFARLQVQCQ